MYRDVFSEFQAEKQYIKINKENSTFVEASCIGSVEEELEVKVITKKCRGTVERKKVKPTGNGKLKETLHVPYALYNELYGRNVDGLATGVNAYGRGIQHPEFAITMLILDEDDERKLKAYPRCILESGPKGKIENGAEEVAEQELEITLLPDEHGYCEYDCLEKDVSSGTKTAWLTNFNYDLIEATSGGGSGAGDDGDA